MVNHKDVVISVTVITIFGKQSDHIVNDYENGYVATIVTDDIGNNTEMTIVNKDGERKYFNAEAYHLPQWAEDNGFEYYSYDVNIPVMEG
jgi:phage regulator Rha-like protein